MKSNIFLKVFVLLLVLFMGLTLKTKAKKSQTVMEFFNNMFLEGRNMQANTTQAASNSTGNQTQEVLGDWLNISSPIFTSTMKFPPVILPDNKEVRIKVDSEYFRLNDAFASGSGDDKPPSERAFWFRLSGSHLYYSMTKSDINIMGALAVEDIVSTKENTNDPDNGLCFTVRDTEEHQWKICAESELIRLKWICAINKNLGRTYFGCEKTLETQALVNLTKTVIEEKDIQPIILIPLPSKKCNHQWSYSNHGADWECTCSDGMEQSPIDLPDPKKAVASPISPLFQYEEVLAKSPITSIDGQVKSEEYIKIKYFKNALRIFHPNLGKIVTLDGAVYIAEEIVFHTPSEHTIDGKRFDLEMQVIHYGQSRGDISKQVVLSFLFQKKAGIYNKFMDDVDFFDLPNPRFTERDITNNLFIPKVLYSSDSSEIPVMKPFSFYTYQGSITFPPCTERTIHYVASEPIPIASAPLELMKEALKIPDMKDEKTGDMYINDESPENYRNAQPLNNRAVFYFDHSKYCASPEIEHKDVKPRGHYEKIPRKATEYFFVNGNEPSGLPGSFVVDEAEAKNQ
jgi:carbonic anhydrase